MNSKQSLAVRSGRSKFTTLAACLLAGAFAGQGAAPARAQDGPAVLRTSVYVNLLQRDGYWDAAAKKEDNSSSSWFPHLEFQLQGPMPGGSQPAVDVTRPDGSQWLHLELPAKEEIKAGEYINFKTVAGHEEAGEKRFTKALGTFGFKIHLKNELAGKDEVLFTGKFKVAKIAKPTAEYKNRVVYYVEHDWTLPIGLLWFAGNLDQDVPQLALSLWLKGSLDPGNLAGYVFYKGKQVSSTKEKMGGVENEVEVKTTSYDKDAPVWLRWRFEWNVRATNPDPAHEYPGTFFLDKNPGEYEIKVLRDGELSRSVKFTVGDDGKVVDNGIVAANKINTADMIVPVKLLGTADGAWNKTAWKTDAFFGNPVQGFTAP